ncbi:ABC transporter permease [Solirhodobacter olei]|uniref:ABC transporter permease n=1 Tax=Solirhodobacter olei TaxID=2493082 RepID=UPI000FD792A8|nr:ABC transporter permease [Solirhodobacter olei]
MSATHTTKSSRQTRTGGVLPHFAEPRFAAIWVALAAMLLVDAIFLPHSVELSTILAVLPFAAFLAIGAAGQTLVLMTRGIDLSVPSIVSLSSVVLLGVSGAQDGRLWLAMAAALFLAMLVGTINGVLIAVLKLNALIVTLAVGSIVMGIAIAYSQSVTAISSVPPSLAAFSSSRILGIPVDALFALVLMVVATLALRKTVIGRRFELVGTNPAAAHTIGVPVRRYQAGAYILAGLLYGLMAILLAGFIQNPTLQIGDPYLLAPIAAAVLGGTALTGGIGSMISVSGAAMFLIQLEQSIKMLGLPSAGQMIIEGVAIALGMYLSERSGTRRRK